MALNPVRRRAILLLIISMGYLIGMLEQGQWSKNFFGGDSHGYYLHSVAAWINQDVGDYDKTISSLKEVYPKYRDPREDAYGIRRTEKGRWYIKYTLGVAVMEAPFFAVGHAAAKLLPQYEATGWSKPYYLAVSLSTIFYVILGFHLLITVLMRRFKEGTVWLIALSIAFATNLWYHGVFVTMAHGFLFFDFCLLIYLTERFYRKPGLLVALGVGAVVGLITLTRVPEVISVLIPLLWGISNRRDVKARLAFFRSHVSHLLVAAAGFFLVFSLQLAYWYFVSGQLVFNPYEGEGFDFLNPKIDQGWFHFKNGWLIYTPIMFFALVGLFWPRKTLRDVRWAILSVVFLQAFVHYSYYAWTYFPGFGSRPMVEMYPLLAFGLGSTYDHFIRKGKAWVPIAVFVGFGTLNLFQYWQLTHGLIYTESGNKAFYLETFGATKPSKAAFNAYDTRERQPKESRLVLVDTLMTENFEDSTINSLSTEFAHSGRHALFVHETYGWNYMTNLTGVRAGDWIYIGVHAYVRPKDHSFDRAKRANLVTEIKDGHGKRKKWRGMNISSRIGNDTYSIWHNGKAGVWGESGCYIRVPNNVEEDWTIRISIWNPHGQRIFVDDAFAVLYRYH